MLLAGMMQAGYSGYRRGRKMMTKFEPHILRLPPMTVASAHAFGENPEREAWKKMEAWAGPLGLLDDVEAHPVFGFNNPNPSPGSREYGYEFWIAVDPGTELGAGIKQKSHQGGVYAVTSCRLMDEIQSPFFQREGHLESWKKLVDWAEANQIKRGGHQALEKPHDPRASEEDLVLDLYLPIIQ
jgi:DNA gyrase inhibitor GyrI